MAKFSLIRPLDQPLARRRLLVDLKSALGDNRFRRFQLIVAYAKSGPLLRMQAHLESWRKAGKTSEAILGIDQQGTSLEALTLALTLFDRVYVTQTATITFHPKIYMFTGPSEAHVFVGSNNLTVGGTEKNFEAAVHIEFALPQDMAELSQFSDAWTDLLPPSCVATTRLDATELARLVAEGVVIGEQFIIRTPRDSDAASLAAGTNKRRSGLKIVPESPLPKRKKALPKKKSAKSKQRATTIASLPGPDLVIPTRGFVIQITPHHNGEIFLSVLAALENPSFFGWPFRGKTTPKKAGNPSYPQMAPDPCVNITVYGASPSPVLTLPAYALNTVYYKTKSEIRVTAAPLVSVVPPYSVMIMEASVTSGINYDITIHRPDSPEYAVWVSACNQSMPSGGKTPRKYGWF